MLSLPNFKFKFTKHTSNFLLEDSLLNIAYMSAYYLYIGIGFFFTYIFFHFFAPKIYSFEFFDFWLIANYQGMFEFVVDRWWIFSAITISNIIFLIVSRKDFITQSKPYNKLAAGLIGSFFAGVSEEIIYRWLLFLAATGTIAGTDFITGGFLFGHGLFYFVFGITKFFVNIATFGTLTDYIYSKNWLVGAAMIVSAAKFREGHENYGPLGYWFSWYFGLFTQVIVFNFGLLPAILIHIIIDVVQDLLIFFDRLLNNPIKNLRKNKK